MVQGGPDVVQGGPDVVQGGSDVVQGGPDVVQGGPDVVQDGLEVVREFFMLEIYPILSSSCFIFIHLPPSKAPEGPLKILGMFLFDFPKVHIELGKVKFFLVHRIRN